MSLATARANLAELLDGLGIAVHPTLPEKFLPPAAVITADQPYVETAPDQLPYGSGWVRLVVVLTAAAGTNPEQDTALDDLITQVLQALYGAPGPLQWWPTAVDQPGVYTPAAGTTYLQTRLHVRAAWKMTPA